MHLRVTRLFLWLATLTLMTLIFGFSNQDGGESWALSGLIAEPITQWIIRLRGGMDAPSAAALFDTVQMIVRKLAHFGEYTLLGLLLTLLYRSYGIQHNLFPVATGVIYAIADELHQRMTPGRVGAAEDVLLDGIGVVAGAVLIRLIIKKWRKPS